MSRKLLGKGIYLYTDIYKNNDMLYNSIKDSPVLWKKTTIKENLSDSYIKERSMAGQVSLAGLMTKDLDSLKLEIYKCYPIFLKIFSDYFLGKEDNFSLYEDIGLIKYSVGDFFENHADSIVSSGRKYSVFYYLNDNYAGGEIVFADLNLKISPKANSMLIFPSGPEYAHEVLPVTYGNKYVISTFLK